MPATKQKLNPTIRNQLESIFYQLIADTTTRDQAQIISGGILTDTELLVIIKRLAVAIYLDKGRSYDNIAHNLKVNYVTIASVQEKIGDPGIQLALQKIKSEAWANDWSQKIISFVKKFATIK